MKRIIGIDGVNAKRLPITAEMIRKISDKIENNRRVFNDKLILAAMCLGTFGLLRAGEFVVTDSSQIHSLQINNLSLLNVNNLPIDIHTATGIQLNKIHFITIHLTQSKLILIEQGPIYQSVIQPQLKF